MSLLCVPVVIALAAGDSGAAADSGTATPERHALLIGVNDYALNDRPATDPSQPRFPDLRGAVNDIELIAEILEERFDFDATRIHKLVDRAATRAGIFEALDALVDRSRPGDVVYVHFSGHGSQVQDFSNDEADGLDETILAHDARTEGVADLTDDELGRSLSRLRGRDVVVVLDSCHSGTATRAGADVVTRLVPPDERLELYADRPVLRGSDSQDGIGYVLLTGAAEHQSALDGPIRGRYYGFFSYLLGRALEIAPPDASAREIHEEVLAGFDRLGRRLRQISMPEPQLEGPAEIVDRPVLRVRAAPAPDPPSTSTVAQAAPAAALQDAGRPEGVGKPERPSSVERPRLAFAAVRRLDENRLLLERAALLDAEPGSLWAVYSAGEQQFDVGGAIAVARASERRGERDLEAILLSQRPRGALDGGRAVPIASPPPRSVRVAWDGVDGALQKSLLDRVGRSGVVVSGARPGEMAEFVVASDEGLVRVLGLGGLHELLRVRVDDPEALDEIARLLVRSQTVSDLLAIENRSTRLALDVRVRPSEGGDERTVSVVGAAAVPAYRVREAGRPRTRANSLQVELTASEDGYVTVVGVDARGEAQLLFPNALSEERGFLAGGRVERGQIIRLPDALDGTNRCGFFWDVAPPAGVDTLQVFLTTDRETTDRIRAFLGELAQRTSAPAGETAGSAGAGDAAGRASTRGAVVTRGAGSTPRTTTALDPTELVAEFALRGIRLVAADAPANEASPATSTSTADDAPAAAGGGDWTSRSVTFLIEDD